MLNIPQKVRSEENFTVISPSSQNLGSTGAPVLPLPQSLLTLQCYCLFNGHLSH